MLASYVCFARKRKFVSSLWSVGKTDLCVFAIPISWIFSLRRKPMSLPFELKGDQEKCMALAALESPLTASSREGGKKLSTRLCSTIPRGPWPQPPRPIKRTRGRQASQSTSRLRGLEFAVGKGQDRFGTHAPAERGLLVNRYR